MPSALLFILLGVMWAVVLVPMWLRKHDEANESRSVDRFSKALRSLSSGRGASQEQDSYDTVVVESRGRVPTPREVMMPGRPAAARGSQVTVSGHVGQRPQAHEGRPPHRAVSAATRRRRLVLGLLVLAAALLAGGLLHRIPVWVTVVPLLVVVLVLVSARRHAARRVEMERRRRTREHLGAAARLAQAEHEQQSSVRRGSRQIMPGPGGQLVDEDVATHASSSAPELADGAWHAVPTTLPTYVTAPAATAVPRVIDRATPGGLSGAAMVEQARRTRHAEADDSGMRVESFEISVSRPVPRHEQDYAEQYVDTSAGAAELDGLVADDEDAISALVADPRTGAGRASLRRRAAG